MHGRFEEAAIAQSGITSVMRDLVRVDGGDFLDRQEGDVVDHFASFFSVAPCRLFTAAMLSFSAGTLSGGRGGVWRLCPSVVISSGVSGVMCRISRMGLSMMT